MLQTVERKAKDLARQSLIFIGRLDGVLGLHDTGGIDEILECG